MFCKLNPALVANDHWINIPGQSHLKVQSFHILSNFQLRRWERSVYRMRSTLTRNVNELDPQTDQLPRYWKPHPNGSRS